MGLYPHVFLYIQRSLLVMYHCHCQWPGHVRDLIVLLQFHHHTDNISIVSSKHQNLSDHLQIYSLRGYKLYEHSSYFWVEVEADRQSLIDRTSIYDVMPVCDAF